MPAADLPSLLFLLAVALNTALLAGRGSLWLQVPLAVLQGFLLIGCQEAKHLCVHRSFLSHRRANDIVGTCCAALFGVNFVAYRHFHLRHHRATCTDADPEGRLYQLLTWPTRWLWVVAPLEQPWLSFYTNRVAGLLVPEGRAAAHRAAASCVCLFLLGLGLLAWWHPQAVLRAYVLPMVVFSWLDFLLTQAEHYDTDIHPGPGRPQGDMAHDVVLPAGLGWLTLHRSLHRVHHCRPGLRWFEAPAALRRDATAAPVSYAAFARRWLAAGPRMWPRRPAT